MITQIIDKGNTIRLYNVEKLDPGAVEIYDLEKSSGIKVKYISKDGIINLYDEARRTFFSIKYEEVTTPVTADLLGLYEAISDMLNNSFTVSINENNGAGEKISNNTRLSERNSLIIIEQLEDIKNLLKLILS